MKNIRTHKCKVETQTQIGNQIVSILPRKYRLFLSILEPDRVEENDIKVRIRQVLRAIGVATSKVLHYTSSPAVPSAFESGMAK
ncbi:unnamed protein product [Albugo candida]|uniref:Uncharacterized protein n=1 Tax=Albugo candida TaxID=65357 RepID=A0A024GHM3_9STRA|nr:unnamed protein product [Albugo candida]|eukprot:CCI45843.1 unnamed protein product [Albugo candida]